MKSGQTGNAVISPAGASNKTGRRIKYKKKPSTAAQKPRRYGSYIKRRSGFAKKTNKNPSFAAKNNSVESNEIDGHAEQKKNEPFSVMESGQIKNMATISTDMSVKGRWVKYKTRTGGTVTKFQQYDSRVKRNKGHPFMSKEDGVGDQAERKKDSPPPKSYSVAIMADPQPWRTDSGDPNSEANRASWKETNKKVAQAIQSQQATFHIVNGDLTEFGRKKTYSDYREVYGQSLSPLYEGLGNHDYANNVGDCAEPWEWNFSGDACAISAVSRMVSEIKKYKTYLLHFSADLHEASDISTPGWRTRLIKGSLSYSWDYEDIHYVQLHNYPTYVAHLQEAYTDVKITKSLDWLKNDLHQADVRGKTTIINFHDAHAPRYRGDKNSHFLDPKNAADLKIFKSIITRHNVKAIFVGHAHRPSYCRAEDDKVFGNIPVYTAGALFYGDYYLIDVKGKDIYVKAYNGKTGKPRLVKDLGAVGEDADFSATCSRI
ncbi:hypothetical protein BAnh1_10370 [Bartonella australis AUST/NH1]|uniref:Calcineurin-like phosphoesterase domain-containing protein n=2 Tax=Bartonella australis TaxID=388640 RepID=M1PE61_BARAA|nr:hypothetical protein BAnh1_10370 [Bartonella australis AUST/NH1]